MKKLQSFSANKLNIQEATNIKGGANIFCELYIGRQKAKGETIDQTILQKLMVWDEGLNKFIAQYA